ncbi:MAG: alpha-L-fucosidase [Bacteroidales bacterium]|nr:alpha-L-fucosidase [Bacteroidales bacterium]
MKHNTFVLAASLSALVSCTGVAPEPFGTVPADFQVEWQKMETNMFLHFGPNTFTSAEWGTGEESEDTFNPTELDCSQWVAVAKAAGFKGMIITAKHHDGFCLWPNPESTHTVAQSNWRDGKGDVLRELSSACADQGMKFGVYISPWDRNDPRYGTDEYNGVFRRALESVLGGTYGQIFEQWFDGACGEGPNGKVQVYDWSLFHGTVRELQPQAVMFSDAGPGCRWVGNERGYAPETCWSTIDTTGLAPGKVPDISVLGTGLKGGSCWIPAECDVSIRPGWFWKESENSSVKTINQLLSIYYTSVGSNSLMLLNVPPDTRGRIHEIDSVRLMEFRAALDEIFSEDLASGAKACSSDDRGRGFRAENVLDGNYDSYWACPDGVTEASLTLELDGARTFNRVQVQEYIPLGQRVESFSVEARMADGSWQKVADGTTIGYKRILLTEKVTAEALRINFSAAACPVINSVSLYLDNIFDQQ